VCHVAEDQRHGQAARHSQGEIKIAVHTNA
jgi:hypothetical protein